MESDSMAANADEATVLHHWVARKLPPVVVLYVAAVFVGMMVLAHFVVHSTYAVKGLALTAVGALVPLAAGIFSRVEYRLTDRGLEHRPFNENKPKEFKILFRLDQVDHVEPTKQGFKFYKPLNETKSFRRFWNRHVSSAYSGDVHVEKADQDTVLGILARVGIACS